MSAQDVNRRESLVSHTLPLHQILDSLIAVALRCKMKKKPFKRPRVLTLKTIETLPRCAFSIQYFPHSKANRATHKKKNQLLPGDLFVFSSFLIVWNSTRSSKKAAILLLPVRPPAIPHPSFATKLLCFITCVMLFGGVEVGNCCSHRNANAEGSCQALIRVKGIHRSDPCFPVPADEPHATSLPTAG